MRLLAALLAVAAAWAQGPEPAFRVQTHIDWKVSGNLPPGAEYHLIYEDPKTHGVQLMVRFPASYSLPPHSHTSDETILILKGKLEIEADGRTTALESGSYAVIPAGLSHSLRTKGWGRCEMLVAMGGPYDVKGLPAVK